MKQDINQCPSLAECGRRGCSLFRHHLALQGHQKMQAPFGWLATALLLAKRFTSWFLSLFRWHSCQSHHCSRCCFTLSWGIKWFHLVIQSYHLHFSVVSPKRLLGTLQIFLLENSTLLLGLQKSPGKPAVPHLSFPLH